jgi:hypothetical protein
MLVLNPRMWRDAIHERRWTSKTIYVEKRKQPFRRLDNLVGIWIQVVPNVLLLHVHFCKALVSAPSVTTADMATGKM